MQVLEMGSIKYVSEDGRVLNFGSYGEIIYIARNYSLPKDLILSTVYRKQST